MLHTVRKLIYLCLLVAVSLAMPAVMKRFTLGFKLGKMRLDFPFQETSFAIPSEVREILSQRFRFLGRGAQCYAFLSEDKKYVLKIFRFDQRHLFIAKKVKRPLKEKVAAFFEGCELAFNEAAEETGLIYIHLTKGGTTSDRLPTLNARDPLRRSFTLPLDQVRFALQKKAEPLMDVLFEAHKQGRLAERVEEIVALIERRIAKKIGNTDPSLWRNFGFLEGRAIEIDFGNYVARPDFSESSKAQSELERFMRPLRSWIGEHAPEYLLRFNARLEGSR